MLEFDVEIESDDAMAEPDFATLFARPLTQWGMRGDPPLWRAMARAVKGRPLPQAFWDVRSQVEGEFEHITGHPLTDSAEPFLVRDFVIGSGMSDGMVLPVFWVRTAIPILIDRWAMLHAERSHAPAAHGHVSPSVHDGASQH